MRVHASSCNHEFVTGQLQPEVARAIFLAFVDNAIAEQRACDPEAITEPGEWDAIRARADEEGALDLGLHTSFWITAD